MLPGYAQDNDYTVIPVESSRTFVTNVNRSNYALSYDRPANRTLFIAGCGGGSTGGEQMPSNGISQTVEGTSSVSLYIGGQAYTYHTGCQAGGFIYFGDGLSGGGQTYNNSWRRIPTYGNDPVAMAAMPTPLRHSSCFAAFANNTKIFRGFGMESTGVTSNKCHIYDIATNTWSAAADAPIDVYGATAIAYGNKICVFFGQSSSLGKRIRNVQIYDIPSNTWTLGPEVNPEWWPNGIAWSCCTIVDDTIWVFAPAGSMPVGSGYSTQAVIKFNVPTGKWSYHATKYAVRYCAQAIYDVSQNDVKLYSGATNMPGDANFFTLARNGLCVVFKGK